MKKIILTLILSMLGHVCFSQQTLQVSSEQESPPVPICYSNSYIYGEYFIAQNYIYAPGPGNKMIGYSKAVTNFVQAKLHVVTYGRGTNAIFKLWTCEVLDAPPAPWKAVDQKFLESSTWVSDP